METRNSFNASDICAIIRASAKCNVKKLRIQDFEVEFETPCGRGNASGVFVNQPAVEETPAAIIVDQQDEEQPFIPDPELMEEMRLAQLMTDDPVAYEQEMIDANLSNAGDTNGNEENS